MTEVETAREIAAWCERHKDADLPAWVVIVCLFDHGSAETELDWESLVAAANRAMDRRRATALRETDGTPKRAKLEQRFADAWAVRRTLEHAAWRAGHCLRAAA
jgi:hypothetical protein